MLKNKNEAFSFFKKLRALLEDGKERKIKVMRTDKGGEFMSREFSLYFE